MGGFFLRRPQALRLHSRLLVLPLDHLVVLPVLQVGGQLRVLGLLRPLPGSVALEGGQWPSLLGPPLQVASEERKSFKGQAVMGPPHPAPQAQVSQNPEDVG